MGRELSSLTQLELETWLEHPAVGLADYAERIRVRSAFDVDDLDGPYWDDDDVDLEEIDELWDAKKGDQLRFMNAIIGARQNGIEPSLLVRSNSALSATLKPPSSEKGETAVATAPAALAHRNSMVPAAAAVDARAGPARRRSSSGVSVMHAVDTAPHSRSTSKDDLVDFAALLGSEGAAELRASTSVVMAAAAPAAPAAAPEVREDIARFVAITGCGLRTATYYVDGALEHGRGVDGAVDYFYERGTAPPPPEYAPRTAARASPFASASGGRASGSETPRAAPYAVGERIETQWWAQGGSKSGKRPSRGRMNRHTYYRGVILAVNGDGVTYAVATDDGDTYTNCPHSAIRPLETRTLFPHSGAWLAAASSTGQWHGVLDVLAPHWRCCGCIDSQSTLCIETRLSVFDFVVLRGGAKNERSASRSAIAGKPELEVDEVGIIVQDARDAQPYRVRCRGTTRTDRWYGERDLERVPFTARRPSIGDSVVLSRVCRTPRGLQTGEVGIVVSDDHDSKPFRIKTRLGISEHYAEDAVVVIPPGLARRAEDATLDVQGDPRAFAAADRRSACWLKLSAPGAVAGRLASHDARLVLSEFRSVKDVTVTTADGTVSQRIDSDELQRWDPRGGALCEAELAAEEREAEEAASSSAARRRPTLCPQTAEVGMRLVLRGGAARGSTSARGGAILLGWRSDGVAHGDCTGGLSSDGYCRVHFPKNDRFVVEVGECTPERLRIGARVSTASVYKGRGGAIITGDGTVRGWKVGSTSVGDTSGGLVRARRAARVAFDCAETWNVSIGELQMIDDTSTLDPNRCWNVSMRLLSPAAVAAPAVAAGGAAAGGGGGGGGDGGSGRKAYMVGSRVSCNWWANGGESASSGEGGRNEPMPCTITAVNADGTFAIACDDGDHYSDAPLSSIIGFLEEAGAAVPLTPLNATIGARIELNLDRLVHAGMTAEAAAVVGEVGGTLLGWRWHSGPGQGDEPSGRRDDPLQGFARVEIDNITGSSDLPLDLVLLSTASNKRSAWCGGPHAGEWRDPGTFGWGTYCKTAAHEDGSVVCAHGGGIVQHPHWSCCGSRVSADDEQKLAITLVGMGFEAKAAAHALRKLGSVDLAVDLLSRDPSGGLPDPSAGAGVAALVRSLSDASAAVEENDGDCVASPWIGAGFALPTRAAWQHSQLRVYAPPLSLSPPAPGTAAAQFEDALFAMRDAGEFGAFECAAEDTAMQTRRARTPRHGETAKTAGGRGGHFGDRGAGAAAAGAVAASSAPSRIPLVALSVDEVSALLHNSLLAIFIAPFKEESVDGLMLNDVEDISDLDDFVEGRRVQKKKLLRIIVEARSLGVLRDQAGPAAASSGAAAVGESACADERSVDGDGRLGGSAQQRARGAEAAPAPVEGECVAPRPPRSDVRAQQSGSAAAPDVYVHDEASLLAMYRECGDADVFSREPCALLLVVKSGRALPRLVEVILGRCPDAVRAQDADGHGALFAASLRKSVGAETVQLLRGADPIGAAALTLWRTIEACGALAFSGDARLAGVRAVLTRRVNDGVPLWELRRVASDVPTGDLLYRRCDTHRWAIGTRSAMEKDAGWVHAQLASTAAASPIGLQFDVWSPGASWAPSELMVRAAPPPDAAAVVEICARAPRAASRTLRGVCPFEAAATCCRSFRLHDSALAALFAAHPRCVLHSASSALLLAIKAAGSALQLVRAALADDPGAGNRAALDDGARARSVGPGVAMLPFERALQAPPAERLDDASLEAIFRATDPTPCFGNGRTALHLAVAARCSLQLTRMIYGALRECGMNEVADRDGRRAHELARMLEESPVAALHLAAQQRYPLALFALALESSFPWRSQDGSRKLTEQYEELIRSEIAKGAALDELAAKLVKGGAHPERLLLAAALMADSETSVAMARVIVTHHEARGRTPVPFDGRTASQTGDFTSTTLAKAHYFRSLGTFLGRYEVHTGRPVHMSATAKVCRAKDCDPSVDGTAVVLKWMRERDEFTREIESRVAFLSATGNGVVVEVVGWHVPASPLPTTSAANVADAAGLPCSLLRPEETDADDEYPYVLVMRLGGESLHHVVASQRVAGVDAAKVKRYCRDLIAKVHALHGGGLVHCDLKPRNVLCSEADEIVLCDLDAATPVGELLPRYLKTSTAYFSPEAARRDVAIARDARTDGGLVARPSLDVWSVGVIVFELCTGRTLFAQDISNDDTVNPRDARRLCLWNGISDAELERVLPRAEAAEHARACHLIRWCLSGDAEERPTLDELVDHPFVRAVPPACETSSRVALHAGGAAVDRATAVPAPLRMRYHVFISHSQVEASGDVGTLTNELLTLGLDGWRDMNQRDLTARGMRQGIFDSDIFIIFLTNSMLSRPFCLLEIGWALEAKKPILIVVETEARFWPFDVGRWQRGECNRDASAPGGWGRRDFGASNATSYADVPVPIKDLIEGAAASGAMLPFRRRDFEVRALAREIVERTAQHCTTTGGDGATPCPLPWGACVPRDELSRCGCFASAERVVHFITSTTPRALAMKAEFAASLAAIAPSTRWVGQAAPAEATGGDAGAVVAEASTTHRLVLLTQSLFEEGSEGKATLERILTSLSTTVAAHTVYVYLPDDVEEEGEAWSFGTMGDAGVGFADLPPGVVKDSIGAHEALKYRAAQPATMAYEHVALCEEVLRRMPMGGGPSDGVAGDTPTARPASRWRATARAAAGTPSLAVRAATAPAPASMEAKEADLAEEETSAPGAVGRWAAAQVVAQLRAQVATLAERLAQSESKLATLLGADAAGAGAVQRQCIE